MEAIISLPVKLSFSPIFETLMLGLLIAVSSDKPTLAAAYGEPPLRYPLIKINQTIPIFKHNAFSATTTRSTTTTAPHHFLIEPVCTGKKWLCGRTCIPLWQFCPTLGSCHPSFPIACSEDGRCRANIKDCQIPYRSKSIGPIASLALSVSTEAPTSSAFTSCRENDWLCGDNCIHKRQFCDLTGSCHPNFAIPCGDGQRCFRRQDNCWNAACLNRDCSKEAKPASPGSGPISELDRLQAKFLRYCPDVRKRLDVCPDLQYMERSFCFYEYEWPCAGRCIPKTEVCPEISSEGCDAGMKRCGKDRCVDRNTPCNGKCWSDTASFLCGSNMCLSKYQLEDYHVCNGTCYDHTIPCNGSCQSTDFFMCSSGNQCYRYWDYCDHEQHCEDSSDEGAICKARDYIVFVVPTLMLLVIGVLVSSLVFVRMRSCAHLRQQARLDMAFEEAEARQRDLDDLDDCFHLETPTSATATIIMTTVPSLNGNSLTRVNGLPTGNSMSHDNGLSTSNNNYDELDTPV